uniref:Uncharacterized protein n=1 Tax=Picea glauca TaxID=3330 RepID=A0A101M2U8_PICGL|nr:hypothetical protein ABT39_MTgene3130 [Picea glauca]QHR86451.1 hypothetical protein Q903MT_gene451 [Picea sitchensis]
MLHSSKPQILHSFGGKHCFGSIKRGQEGGSGGLPQRRHFLFSPRPFRMRFARHWRFSSYSSDGFPRMDFAVISQPKWKKGCITSRCQFVPRPR